MRRTADASHDERSRPPLTIHLLGVPMDLGSGRRGVDMGPSAIRIAGLAERLAELGHKVVDEGDLAIKNMEELKVGRRPRPLPPGDRPRLPPGQRQGRAHRRARGTSPWCWAAITRSPSAPSPRSRPRPAREGKKVGLLWVDAHGDINTPETSPSGNIHGMPVAALLGEGPPELTSIGGEGPKLDPRNIAMVGIRSLDEGEKVRLKRYGVQVHTMSQVDRQGIERVMKEALARVSDGTDRVHVSFDLDALDPEVAPGVGTPVKGGLDYREAHLLMEILSDSGLMTSLEVVEANPILDVRNASAAFAVELVQSAFGKRIL